jgi:hypothetical protein
MSVWKELGRFLESGTPLLEEGLKSLKATNELLEGLRPTVEATPELVRETHRLVVDARGLLKELAPVLIEISRRTVAQLPPVERVTT